MQGKCRTAVALVVYFFSLPPMPAAQPVESPDIEVWAVPSIRKVRPEDRVERSNLVWSAEDRLVSLAGARNERVPFQLVITTPPPASRYQPAASGFFVEASDLESDRGRISRQHIHLFFEHVVLNYGRSSPVGETGFWPDALVPLTGPFGMQAQFRSAVRNRAIWVDIEVPPDAPAGVYRGELQVTWQGQSVDTIAVMLKVYDFALPEETHLITYMGISRGQLRNFYRLEEGSEELERLLHRYYEFLYAHRMEPWFNDALEPVIVLQDGNEVEVRFDDAIYRRYMGTLRARRVILETAPGSLRRGEEPFSDALNARVRSYLQQVARYFERNGWQDKLVFNSPIDEPNTAQHYEDTRRWAELVHEAAPGIPFLVTESPVPDRAEWGTLVGYADHFAVHGNALNRLEVRDAIRSEQEKGGEVTWYISCDQAFPQPNYFIDAPAMDPVLIPWITWRYGMEGILYWAIDFWSQTPDPWIDPVTFLSGFLCSDGYILNGEGSLIYPGNRAGRYSEQADVDGPVSSIRLELLREGIEDYEYLWLLRSLGDPAFADRIAGELVVDVSTFSRNVEALFAAREKMAARIEELLKERSGK